MMNNRTPGERVGAVLSMNAAEIRFLGFGVYDGDHEPPFGPLGRSRAELDDTIAKKTAEGKLPADYRFTNPRITLDSGAVVWGCQCWWGSEALVKKRLEDGRRVVVVDANNVELKPIVTGAPT